jgi:hypothetical protein
MPFSKGVILHKTPTIYFYFYYYFFFPMITAMYHAQKEASNSKRVMPTEIGISFFEMPHILQRIDSAT